MPIFEYVCRDCGHAFETIVNGSREPQCPSCNGQALDKQLSVFAVSSAPQARETQRTAPGGCGRCGDPHGPCAMN
ncbi:MAG TPA: zinc ribbon domain-containing protein [Vicinamibacterales bacterium]|nr:zinc ribbon domain-containing protein [Vicinamibacterales bacterium]